MFKKVFVLMFMSFLLYSCWSTKEVVVIPSWLIKKETVNISISIPTNWYVIEDKAKIFPNIKEWKIELAAISKEVVNWFSNNLLILSDDLKTLTTSKDFSMINNVWASKDYLDYKKIASKDFKFVDEEVSVLYIFQAKYNIGTPTLKFLQTAHICNQNKAYFLTLAISTSVIDTSKYEEFLATFTCK